MFVLLFQLLVSSLLFLRGGSVYLIGSLLFFNLALFLFLSLEPYWKIGAWLMYLVMAEVLLYIINIVYVKMFVYYSSIFNLIVILSGILVSFVAHQMKVSEKKYKPVNSEETEIVKDNPEQENKPEIKSYVLTNDNFIHSTDCSTVQDEDNVKIIGSKRYAESKKYTVCDVCQPF